MKTLPQPETTSPRLEKTADNWTLVAFPEGVFDDVTHLVAQICGIPITLVGSPVAQRHGDRPDSPYQNS